MTARNTFQYLPRYCVEAIEYLGLGHTVAAFAGEIGVSRAALLAWAREYPEFADALDMGQARALAFWEQMLADIAKSGKGNATAAIFAAKNCAAEIEARGADKSNEHELPAWSDLEVARRIAHILTRGSENSIEMQ